MNLLRLVIRDLRLETIVATSVAEALLDRAAVEAETIELVAFSHDVAAVPRAHFA